MHLAENPAGLSTLSFHAVTRSNAEGGGRRKEEGEEKIGCAFSTGINSMCACDGGVAFSPLFLQVAIMGAAACMTSSTSRLDSSRPRATAAAAAPEEEEVLYWEKRDDSPTHNSWKVA
ncbi:hypothetical protein BHE74_00016570 [Ensete ventricosum]|nr:hypothetical protein GW17_00049198 [Ensete ventricosum]RWW75410.1 hypothetical protein BHE74_00016570 [Ensete ventricosum]